MALLLIDIDKFKVLNDLSGHLVGDAVLRAVADEVRGVAGPLELPCRLGGDEFALLLRVADEGDLANRALGLIAAVRALRLPSLRERGLTISVGGVFCSDPGGWSSWYSQGDLALYEAKSRGGDRWRLAL
jgi:diguanylate cyclase (GGDEF)-like protein